MQSKQDKNTKNYYQDICSGLIHIIFAALFGSFVRDSSHYNDCSINSSIYIWGYTTFIYHIVAIGCSFLLLPFLIIIFVKSGAKSSCLLLLINLVRLLCGVGQIVCFSGLCYSYGEEENCFDSDLRKLTLAYIILCSIGLGMAGLVLCCLIFGGACVFLSTLVSVGKMKELNNNNNQALGVDINKEEIKQEEEQNENVAKT